MRHFTACLGCTRPDSDFGWISGCACCWGGQVPFLPGACPSLEARLPYPLEIPSKILNLARGVYKATKQAKRLVSEMHNNLWRVPLALFLSFLASSAVGESQSLLQKYSVLKEIVSDNLGKAKSDASAKPQENEPVFLDQCETYVEASQSEVIRKKCLDSRLLTLALYYYTYRDVFMSTYYPNSFWQPILKEYENQNLARIAGGRGALKMDLRATARRFQKYRKSHPSEHLPKAVGRADGCGAGEETVKIVVHGKYKRIQYIEGIDYAICNLRKEGICNYWTDYSNSESGDQVSGRYKVLVTWEDDSQSPLIDLNVATLSAYSPAGDPLVLKFEINR